MGPEAQFAVLVENAAEINNICRIIRIEINSMVFLLNQVKQINFNTICLIDKVGNLNYIYDEVSAVIKINFINYWIPRLETMLANISKQRTKNTLIDTSNLNFTLKNEFEFTDLQIYISDFYDNFNSYINDFKNFLNERTIVTKNIIDEIENINFVGTLAFFPKNVVIGHPDYKSYRDSYLLIADTKTKVTTIINYLLKQSKNLHKKNNSNLLELRRTYIGFNNIFFNDWEQKFKQLISFIKVKVSVNITNLKDKSLTFEKELKVLFERILIENTNRVIPQIETSVTTIINETKNTATFLHELLQNLLFNFNDKNCCDEKINLILHNFEKLDLLLTYKIIELKMVISNFETYLNPLQLAVTDHNLYLDKDELTILVKELTEIINFSNNIKNDYSNISQTNFEFEFFDDFNYKNARAWLDKKSMLPICHLSNKRILNDTERFEIWTDSHFPNLKQLMMKDLYLNMKKFFNIMEDFETSKNIILDDVIAKNDILVLKLNNKILQVTTSLNNSITFLTERQDILNNALEIYDCNNEQLKSINNFKNEYYRNILLKKNPQQVILKFFNQAMLAKNGSAAFFYEKNRYLEEALIMLYDTTWTQTPIIDYNPNINFANIESWFNNKETLDICNLDKNFVDSTNKNKNLIKFLTNKTETDIKLWKNNFLNEFTNVFINHYLFENKNIQKSGNYTETALTNFLNTTAVTSINEIEDFKNFECANFIDKTELIINNIIESWKHWQTDDSLENCYLEQVTLIAHTRQELFHKIITKTIIQINTHLNKVKALKTNLDISALTDLEEQYEIKNQYQQLQTLITHIKAINELAFASEQEFANDNNINLVAVHSFFNTSNFSICSLDYNLESVKNVLITNDSAANFDWNHLFLKQPEFSVINKLHVNTNTNGITHHWFLYVFLAWVILLASSFFCKKNNKKRKKKKLIPKQQRKQKKARKKNLNPTTVNMQEQIALKMPFINEAQPVVANSEDFTTINLATINEETETCLPKQKTTIQL